LLVFRDFFEGSKLQATPGKLAIRIKVTDLSGNRIGFWRSTGRTFARIIGGLPLYIGDIVVGFTRRRQAFHDMIFRTLVVQTRFTTAEIVAMSGPTDGSSASELPSSRAW
jgi:uncharacterized RDD family membrane protein YckC